MTVHLIMLLVRETGVHTSSPIVTTTAPVSAGANPPPKMVTVRPAQPRVGDMASTRGVRDTEGLKAHDVPVHEDVAPPKDTPACVFGRASQTFQAGRHKQDSNLPTSASESRSHPISKHQDPDNRNPNA